MLVNFGKPHDSPITSLCITLDSQYLFSSDSEGNLVQWFTEVNNDHINYRRKKIIRSNKKKSTKKPKKKKVRTLYEIIQNTNLSESSDSDNENQSDQEEAFVKVIQKMVKNYGKVHNTAIVALSSYKSFIFSIDENSNLSKWNTMTLQLVKTYSNLSIPNCHLLQSCNDYLIICSDHGT